MLDSFKSDAEWESDLNEFFELLKRGTPASYIERMAELKARKGEVYASAIEAEATRRYREDTKGAETSLILSKKEVILANEDELVERISTRVAKLVNEGEKLKKRYRSSNKPTDNFVKLNGIIYTPDDFKSDPDFDKDIKTYYDFSIRACELNKEIRNSKLDVNRLHLMKEGHEFENRLLIKKGEPYLLLVKEIGANRAMAWTEERDRSLASFLRVCEERERKVNSRLIYPAACSGWVKAI